MDVIGCQSNREWGHLTTYSAGEFRASGARRTLRTCPLLTTNFARSLRFLEVPKA